MGTVGGTHDPFIAPSGVWELKVNGEAAEPTQCSPSQLPDLLRDREELDGGELNTRVVAALRELLCCPICHRLLLHDPAVVDTCGHVFCYKCINLGIENGCLPVAAVAQAEEERSDEVEEVHFCGESDHRLAGVQRGDAAGEAMVADPRTRPARPGRSQRRRQPRKRRLKFTCPVCLGPAHKWNLVRVRFFSDLVTEALSHPTLAKALPAAEAKCDASAQMDDDATRGEGAPPPSQRERTAAQKQNKFD
ncbi:conserved RING finger protein [Trypanosoma rangeli]|uniref:Conserved RING finger protein n=1 Tax=Trypanosoma rangeli TaxID=5698 RepID=A0A422NBI9_TRYRA|nr:conserved RING finger protein [Trypanosoma rangeli]RNF02833.1 conserved RING finger protein [Trypanosoma rangeli]|eukprot:RNF02833.1 conserved RING finger protein [Trypanosoma rangeli]